MTDTWEETRGELTAKIDEAVRAYNTSCEQVDKMGADYRAQGGIPLSAEFDGPLFWLAYWVKEMEKSSRDYHIYTTQLEGAREWYAEQEDK